jgi:hypothetical protein
MPLGMLETLQGSELFTFFNIHEVSRQAGSRKGVHVVQCKPGGFQESIDISFDVDAGGGVLVGHLILDRSWIGDGEHVNPFANDITKSFIDILVPSSDHAAIEPLLRAIMDAKGIDDKRIYLHDQPRDMTPGLDAIKALGVYLGVIPKHEIAMASSRLRMENATEGERARFRIDIEAKRGKA